MNFSPINEEINLKLDTIKKLRSEIAQLTSQLNRAYNLLEKEVYTIEIFKERQANLKNSIFSLEEQLNAHESDLNHLRELQITQELFAPKVRHLLDTYKTNSTELNNSILKELIARIDYEKETRNTRGKLDNCNFSLSIFPHISN